MISKKIGLATLHILLVLYLWIQYINIKLLIYIIAMASYIQINIFTVFMYYWKFYFSYLVDLISCAFRDS